MLTSRTRVVSGLVILSFCFLIIRLYSLHVLEHEKWETYANKMHHLVGEVVAYIRRRELFRPYVSL